MECLSVRRCLSCGIYLHWRPDAMHLRGVDSCMRFVALGREDAERWSSTLFAGRATISRSLCSRGLCPCDYSAISNITTAANASSGTATACTCLERPAFWDNLRTATREEWTAEVTCCTYLKK